MQYKEHNPNPFVRVFIIALILSVIFVIALVTTCKAQHIDTTYGYVAYWDLLEENELLQLKIKPAIKIDSVWIEHYIGGIDGHPEYPVTVYKQREQRKTLCIKTKQRIIRKPQLYEWIDAEDYKEMKSKK